ncbi:MAG: hypothetical protein ACRELX_13930, partial [Longimicrobiales bacterium]
MSDDERFDEMIREAARELDPPPPAPREEMWARIEQARSARRVTAGRPWIHNGARWVLPLAATLAIG